MGVGEGEDEGGCYPRRQAEAEMHAVRQAVAPLLMLVVVMVVRGKGCALQPAVVVARRLLPVLPAVLVASPLLGAVGRRGWVGCDWPGCAGRDSLQRL